MKALFIGGTGTISLAISKLLVEQGWDLYLLNRGNRSGELDTKVNFIHCDIDDKDQVQKLLEGMDFDVVADFIAYVPEQLERDYELFQGRPNSLFLSVLLLPIKNRCHIIR